MAAKEHTDGLAQTDIRRSVQSSGTNTDGVKSVVENKPVFTEGTFAEQTLSANIGEEGEEEKNSFDNIEDV